jgi:hypothetical protein
MPLFIFKIWKLDYFETFCTGGIAYVVVMSPPATEETGAMGREIKSRQGFR